MIIVFKTSVKTKRQVKQLQPHINQLLPMAKWNFDLQDCDHILRIDSGTNIVVIPIAIVTDLIKSQGYSCEELL